MRLMLFHSLCYLALSLAAALPQQDAQPTSPPQSQEATQGNVSTGKPSPDITLDGKPIVRAGKDVRPPEIAYEAPPEFPDVARMAGFQAPIKVELVVGTNGTPQQMRVVQGAGMGLDKAAVEAVARWRFHPAIQDGRPVAVMIMVDVDFRLYSFRDQAPLHSPEANAGPPQFPGVDVAAYPLVVHVEGAAGKPDGGSYKVVAQGTLNDPGGERRLSLSCSARKKQHCPFITAGNYPARWKVENRQLEIMGKDAESNSWGHAEYAVEFHGAAPQANP